MAIWGSHILCPWDHKPGWLLGKIVFWTLQKSRFSNVIPFYSWKPVKIHNFQYFWSIQASGGTDMYVLEVLKMLAFVLEKYWKPVICKDLWRKLYKCDWVLYQQVLSWLWGGTAPDQGRNLWDYQELKPSAYSMSCKRPPPYFDNHSLNPVLRKVQVYSYCIVSGFLILSWQHIL